jgi:hypothetical protein
MNRLIVIASLACCTIAASACGSDSTTAPTDSFNGTWAGLIYNESVSLSTTVTVTQTGNAFSGTGSVSSGGQSEAFTITGTSTPPNVTAMILATSGSNTDTLTVTATYISADSIAGTAVEDGAEATIGLKKQ